MSDFLAGNLLFRVDANRSIGAGHFMRCLALAKTARIFGVKSQFCMLKSDSHWTERAELEEFALVPAVREADWMVVDGYQFDAPFFEQLANWKAKILALDDCNDRGPLQVDAILNGNPGKSPEDYENLPAETIRFVGGEFAPLNPAFRSLERKPVKGRVLLTFGGARFDELYKTALQALSALGTPLEVVLAGQFDPKKARYPNLEINSVGLTSEMPQLMATAEFAICGGGSTTLELACLGVPAVAVQSAENQRSLLTAMSESGAIWSAGEANELTPDALAALIREMRSANRHSTISIDPFGADRVIQQLFKIPVRLRPAQPGDCDLLFDWANDPQARQNSLNSEAIPPDTHQRWFRDRLESAQAYLLIGIDERETPAGIVRFEERDGRHTVSFTVAPEFRGRGVASHLLHQGIEWLRLIEPAAKVNGVAKRDNVASRRTMERCGFGLAREDGPEGVAHFELSLN